MLNKTAGFLIVIFIVFSGIADLKAATYYSRASGNWTSNTTWSTSSGGGSVGSGIYPVAGDIVYLERGYTITVNNNAACASVTFRNTYTGNTTLTISGGYSLSVSGAFSMNRPSSGYSFTVNVDDGMITTGSLTMSATTSGRNNIINISTGTFSISGTTTTGTTGCRFVFADAGTLEFGGAFTSSPTITTAIGSTVIYSYSGSQTVRATTYSNLTLGGSGTKTTTGITVSEILSMQGSASATAVPTYGSNATLQYMGNAAQTAGVEFPSTFSGTGGVIINNSNGVILNASRTLGNASKLTLTNGVLSLSSASYILSITNSSNTAIEGGTVSSFVEGNLRWTLPASNTSATAFIFPVGENSRYLPFTLENPTTGTGTITAQVLARSQNSGGSTDGTLSNLSPTEYWSLTTSGSFTNTSVSVSRPEDITPYNAIAGSSSQTGTYTSLAGTVGSNGVSNSNAVGSNRYFAFAQKMPTITTGIITGSPFCAGTDLMIPFTITESFTAGNVFTAQLSNSAGSFASPVILGTLTSTSAGTISGTIPSNTNSGTGYRIRVISSSPDVIGSENGSNLTINASPTITATTPATRCGEGTLTIGATASIGIVNWYNVASGGSLIGTGITFTTPSISTTTTFYAEATSGGCNSVTRTPIVATVMPSVTISASGGGSYCTGSTLNLSSNGTNVTNQYWTGPNGYYSLDQNPTITNATAAMSGTYIVTGSNLSGINLVTNGDFESGATGFTSGYTRAAQTSSGLQPESTYDVVALPSSRHSNFCSCPDHTPGTGLLQMVVNGAGSEITIWSQTVTVTPNTTYQFTYWEQTVVNGNDQNPSKLQLFVNGSYAGPVYTANPTTGVWTKFTYNWTSGPTVTTAILALKNENFAASGNDFSLDDIEFQQVCDDVEAITISVASSFVPSVSINASSNPVCQGIPVTFTATPVNQGANPVYQWRLNGSNVGTNSPTYINNNISNGSVVSCVMTSGLSCASPANATSNSITITVSPVVAANVSIAASDNPVCDVTGVTFSATPVNGGSSPAYQWNLNGVNVGTNSAIYSNALISNNDQVFCIMTSSLACATNNPSSSNTITMVVGNTIGNNELDFSFGTHGSICATASENATATGNAPAGTFFNYVNFASYGTPGGTCPDFTYSSCHAATSQTVAENNILGNSSFSINASNAVFGDPCSGTFKRLNVRATYTESVCSGTLPGTITGSLPTGGTGIYSYLWEFSTTGPTSGFSPATGTNNQMNYSPPALYQNTWFRRTVYSGGCSSISKIIVITITGYNTWTGQQNTDWNNINNWTCSIPNLTTDVTISSGLTNYPVLSTGAVGQSRNLTIEAGASLTINSNILQIAGIISNNGSFDATNGTIEMRGSIAQVIPANTFLSNTIAGLIIDNPAGASLLGNLNVTGIVKATLGNLASDGYLTLISGTTQTALIDGSGNGEVTGNVTMQRYVPSGFGYKYLSSPFQSATVAGFADEVNLMAAFPAFYEYDENKESTGWTNYSDAGGLLEPMSGYCLNYGTSSAPVTTDLTGIVNNHALSPVSLYNHNKIYTQGFNLVGNPYPSPIDWNAALGWTKSNIDNALYFFKAGTTDQYGGTYSSYINGVSSNGIASNIIPSMQGFFIHASDGSYPVSALFGMDNRVRVNNLSPAFHKTSNENDFPLVRLSAGFDGENNLADPVVVYFSVLATQGFDSNLDALKLFNTDIEVPNLYMLNNSNQKLSICALPFPANETIRIPLGIKTEKDGHVNFNAMTIENLPSGQHAYLYDELNGNISDLQDNLPYGVSLSGGTSEGRFYLLFSKTNFIDQSEEFGFRVIYSNGILKVDAGLSADKNRCITLSNLLGQIITTEILPESGQKEIHSTVNPGIYILTLNSPRSIKSQKIYIPN